MEAFIFTTGCLVSFLIGWLVARNYVWSNKTNQLVKIISYETSEDLPEYWDELKNRWD